MKVKVLYCFLLFFSISFSQRDSLKLQWAFNTDSSSIWSVDELNNVLVQHKSTLIKLNQFGQKVNEQSIKKTGEFAQIDAGNGLKIACFSKEQQTICFFDNTLTQQNNCVELSDFDILTPTVFCQSIQTDKLWIYDEMNSEIVLLTTRSNQVQKLPNLRNISSIESVHFMKEIDNQLYLIGNPNYLLVLDVFGTVVNEYEVLALASPQIIASTLFGLQDGVILAYDFKDKTVSFPFPELKERIWSVEFKNNFLYIQTNSALLCYSIQ